MEEKKTKILITWGLGYVGSHTAVVFGKAGYEVIIIDNLSNSYLENLGRITEILWEQPGFYDTDLKNYDELKKVIEEHQDLDWIIHCADKKYINESCQDPFLYYDDNIVATINLYKAVAEVWIKNKNIVLSSTAMVYDTENLLPPFGETDKIIWQNPYATSKIINEQILKDMTLYKNFNAVILRYFNPIGAHHSWILWEQPKGIPSNVFPYSVKVALGEIDEVKIYGDDYDTKDGTWVRDYFHILDLAEAHLLAFQYIKEFTNYKKENYAEKKGLYDVFNIGSWQGYTVKEIINLVEKVTETNIPYKIHKRRPWDVATLLANPQKAKQILGRETKRSIYQAIEDWVKFFKKNSDNI